MWGMGAAVLWTAVATWSTVDQSRALAPMLRRPRMAPRESLDEGRWVKLICGAANQDLPAIRNLALVFTLAGADCIDCSADAAVVSAVREGVDAALVIESELGIPQARPWIMVSIQDGDEDLHFRKAAFDPSTCPPACARPCVASCPADAIAFTPGEEGVVEQRCFGCGRCVPTCPYDLIRTRPYDVPLSAVRDLLPLVDAVEIHTTGTRLEDMARTWDSIGDAAVRHLRLVAVSLPDLGPGRERTMADMDAILGSAATGGPLRMWQLDGRPMSGDIGPGATRAAVQFAQRVCGDQHFPHAVEGHYLSVAGGTNDRTLALLAERGLVKGAGGDGHVIHGIAYGSYARKLVGWALSGDGDCEPDGPLESRTWTLARAVGVARGLVQPIKGR